MPFNFENNKYKKRYFSKGPYSQNDYIKYIFINTNLGLFII